MVVRFANTLPKVNNITYSNNGMRNINLNQRNQSIINMQRSSKHKNAKTIQKKDTENDGQITPNEKLKSMGNGILNSFKGMFCNKNGKFSIKRTLTTVAITAGAIALTAATGGAAAPALVALGATLGAVQLGTGIVKACKAKTDIQAKQAWEDIGSGTLTVAASVLGAKGSLKIAGIKGTYGMTSLEATAYCFKATPRSIETTLKTLSSREALTNIQNFSIIRPKSNLDNRVVSRDDNFKFVRINTDKVDALWKLNTKDYISKGGKGAGAIKGKYSRFKTFANETNQDIHASILLVNEREPGILDVSFWDGRNRFAFMRDQKIKSIPVNLSQESLELAKKYGLLTE